MSKSRSEELSLFQTDEIKRLVDLLPDDPANQRRKSIANDKMEAAKGESGDANRHPEILSLTPASPKRGSSPPTTATDEEEESPNSPSKNDERWKQEIHQIKRKSSHQKLDRGSLHRLRQSALLMGSNHRHGRSKSFSEVVNKNTSKQNDSPWLRNVRALKQEYSSLHKNSGVVVDSEGSEREPDRPQTKIKQSTSDDWAEETIEKLDELGISDNSDHSGSVSKAPDQSKTDESVPSFVESVELDSDTERSGESPRDVSPSNDNLLQDAPTQTASAGTVSDTAERDVEDDDSCSYYEEVVEESVASFEGDGENNDDDDDDDDSATEVEVVIIEVTDDEASDEDINDEEEEVEEEDSDVSSAFFKEDEEEFDAESFGSGYSLAVASVTCKSDVSMSIYGEDDGEHDETILEASGHSTLSAFKDDSEHTEIVIEDDVEVTGGLLGPVEADHCESIEEGI